jgi:hypothetical protein
VCRCVVPAGATRRVWPWSHFCVLDVTLLVTQWVTQWSHMVTPRPHSGRPGPCGRGHSSCSPWPNSDKSCRYIPSCSVLYCSCTAVYCSQPAERVLHVVLPGCCMCTALGSWVGMLLLWFCRCTVCVLLNRELRVVLCRSFAIVLPVSAAVHELSGLSGWLWYCPASCVCTALSKLCGYACSADGVLLLCTAPSKLRVYCPQRAGFRGPAVFVHLHSRPCCCHGVSPGVEGFCC